MRCLYHPLKKAVGYCHVCGTFGCSQCLTDHKGQFYCKKDYKPIADELARKAKHDKNLARKDRQRLVIHVNGGETVRGMCYALNPASNGIHLDLVDENGQSLNKTRQLDFADCKAVFFVKSYDGKFDAGYHYHDLHEKGAAIVVDFKDGEVLHGYLTSTYNTRDARFFVVPGVKDTNNLSILVERSAVAGLHSPQEYKEKKYEEAESYVSEHMEEGLSKEEAHGDFHFERHEYKRALKFYRAGQREDPESQRLRRKVISTQYNIGITHIKQHEYREALASMKAVLEADPGNERAQKKAAKLREAIKKRASHRRSRSAT